MRVASTVPSGDTPCVTAGDARRVNPWREKPSHPPTPAVSNNIHTCYSPSTLAVRRFLRRVVVLSLVHGFSLAPLGYHPRLSMVCLRRRREILCYGRSGVRHAALLRLCVAVIVCEVVHRLYTICRAEFFCVRTLCPRRRHTMRNRG